MAKVDGKTTTINREVWTIRHSRYCGKIHGKCDYRRKVITVYPRKHRDGFDLLDTYIHEFMHAKNDGWSESAVTDLSLELSRMLWTLGYRPSVGE